MIVNSNTNVKKNTRVLVASDDVKVELRVTKDNDNKIPTNVIYVTRDGKNISRVALGWYYEGVTVKAHLSDRYVMITYIPMGTTSVMNTFGIRDMTVPTIVLPDDTSEKTPVVQDAYTSPMSLSSPMTTGGQRVRPMYPIAPPPPNGMGNSGSLATIALIPTTEVDTLNEIIRFSNITKYVMCDDVMTAEDGINEPLTIDISNGSVELKQGNHSDSYIAFGGIVIQ